MMSLVKLPYELVTFFIIPHLELADTWALSLSCRRLRFLFYEPNVAKLILEVSCAAPCCGVATPGRKLGPGHDG